MRFYLEIAVVDDQGVDVGDTHQVAVDIPDATVAERAVQRITNAYGTEGLDPDKNHDYTYYANGQNQLTLSESAQKAANRVTSMFVPHEPLDNELDAIVRVYQTCLNLLTMGAGRQYLYKLAGGIVTGRKEGQYKGLPLSLVFEYRAQQALTEGPDIQIGA